jgi:hypothetical protein
MKGYDPDRIAQSEADHFVKCPGCGEWFDMRDLAQVLGHVHDAERSTKLRRLVTGQCSERGAKKAKRSADRTARRIRMRGHSTRWDYGFLPNSPAVWQQLTLDHLLPLYQPVHATSHARRTSLATERLEKGHGLRVLK